MQLIQLFSSSIINWSKTICLKSCTESPEGKFQAPCVCPAIGLGSPPDQIVSLFRGQQLGSQQQRRHTWALAATGHESPRQNPSLTWGSLPFCPGARLQSVVLLKASSAEAVPEAPLSGLSTQTTPCTSLHQHLPNKLPTQLLQRSREAASISNTLLPPCFLHPAHL